VCSSIEPPSNARYLLTEEDLVGLASLKGLKGPSSHLTWIFLLHQILLKPVELVKKLLMSFQGIYQL
jgi:hypothetical protein